MSEYSAGVMLRSLLVSSGSAVVVHGDGLRRHQLPREAGHVGVVCPARDARYAVPASTRKPPIAVVVGRPPPIQRNAPQEPSQWFAHRLRSLCPIPPRAGLNEPHVTIAPYHPKPRRQDCHLRAACFGRFAVCSWDVQETVIGGPRAGRQADSYDYHEQSFGSECA